MFIVEMTGYISEQILRNNLNGQKEWVDFK